MVDPAFAVPSADNRHLVISALTGKGLRYAGYGVAVNHDAGSHISPAPELMQFHLKTVRHRFLLPSTHQKNSRIICSARWVLIVPGNGSARKMHEHTPRGDMIAVSHSECEQYFVLFNIVLCSSMFIDRDECKKHTHITKHSFVFPPPKIGGSFFMHQSVFDAIFHFNSTFALLTQKKRSRERLGAPKSILDRHLDLFVFLEAKMQGHNRAPLFDRLNSYNQIAFFVQFGDGWLDYHLIQVF